MNSSQNSFENDLLAAQGDEKALLQFRIVRHFEEDNTTVSETDLRTSYFLPDSVFDGCRSM